MRGALMGALVGARDGWLLGKGAERRRRDHNRSLKNDCWKWIVAAVRIVSPTANSPEAIAQKCATGRDAVQITEHQEVASNSWIPVHPSPANDCNRLGAGGEGASTQLRA
jgi:hypothetical protein